MIREPVKRQKTKRDLHWTLRALFDVMEEKGLTWDQYSNLIQSQSGKRIPPSSIKYWFYGHGEPKVSEYEIMAAALGYEFDIMQVQDEETKPSEVSLS